MPKQSHWLLELGSGDGGCWDRVMLDLTPLPTGMREKGNGTGVVCGGLRTHVGHCPQPVGSTRTHTPSQPAPPWGQPQGGDVETTRAGYGVSLLLHSQNPHSLGQQSPLQRQSHHCSSHQHPSVGWDCNHACGEEMPLFHPHLSSGGW